MTFAGTARVHKSLPAWRRMARVSVAMGAAAVLLSACGGGDQVKKFKPTAIVSFGDEGSALVSETLTTSAGSKPVRGLKYGVNAVSRYRNTKAASPLKESDPEVTTATSGNALLAIGSQTAWTDYPAAADYSPPAVVLDVEALSGADVVLLQYQGLKTLVTDSTSATVPEGVDISYRYTYSCYDSPLWIQIVARNYGLGYKTQCPMESGSGGTTYAENGATVAGTAAQVAAHRGELNSSTLVTLMAGKNDVVEVYAQLKAGTLSPDAAKAELTTRGAALAAIANDVIKTGARVLLVRLPDMGLSPLAQANANTGGVNTLYDLTRAFNNGILNNVTNDGHKIALFNFFDYSRYMYNYIRDGNTYDNIVNLSTPVCSSTVGRKPDGTLVTDTSGAGLLYCNSYTLNSGVSTSTYFWADQTRMGPAAHASLGTRAFQLADDNPL